MKTNTRIQRRAGSNTVKMYVFTVQTEEGNKQVKTSCNMFSAPFLNEQGERTDTCLKCKQDKGVIDLCLYRLPEKKSKKAGSKKEGSKRETKSDYRTIIEMFIDGKSKTSIIDFIQTFTTEAGSKKMYSNCSCIFNACLFPNRKENLVHQVAREVLENNSSLDECLKQYEGKDKQTIKLVHQVSLCFKAIKEEREA